jgi:hypothetical protein
MTANLLTVANVAKTPIVQLIIGCYQSEYEPLTSGLEQIG